MNRRKAIFSFLLIGGGATAGFSGYKWFSIHKTPDWAYLDTHQELIGALAETIIPSTETPGAKAAMTQLVIISLVQKVADRKAQNIFIDGLKEVEHYAASQFNSPFTALTAARQQQIVAHFRDEGKNYAGVLGKVKNKFMGKSFFHILKEYSTIAYCTSKAGATQGLAYDFIPGQYNSCMPLAPGQKSWATK